MEMSRSILALVGRRLSDQMLELNPQPIPPGEQYGLAVASRLADLAWTADKLGIDVRLVASWDDNPCGTGLMNQRLAEIIAWLLKHVPLPPPDPEPGPDWTKGYFLALAGGLAEAQAMLPGSSFLEDAADRAREALETSMTG